jgi:DNA-binding HxlR family transcriptional regulator
MALRRSYEDGCAAAHALDVVGERWALLVVRELAFGAKRFTDLRTGLPGISPNVLTQRLEELEAASVLRRRRLLPPAATSVYELTPWGQELLPILMALGRWGARSPQMAPGGAISVNSLMMSLQTMFDAEAATGMTATVGLEMGLERFQVQVDPRGVQVTRGEAASPDAVFVGEPSALSAVIYGGRKFTEALREGDFSLRGDKVLARKFLALFHLPEPAATAEASGG